MRFRKFDLVMKSYTDLEQSKKLAEILPLESADMHYSKDFDGSWFVDLAEYTSVKIPKYVGNVEEHLLPCWSLASLLDVLPNNEHITTTVSRGSWQIEPINYLPNTWWCEYEDSENLTEFNISADNPVDACVAMIEKLNELKLLRL